MWGLRGTLKTGGCSKLDADSPPPGPIFLWTESALAWSPKNWEVFRIGSEGGVIFFFTKKRLTASFCMPAETKILVLLSASVKRFRCLPFAGFIYLFLKAYMKRTPLCWCLEPNLEQDSFCIFRKSIKNINKSWHSSTHKSIMDPLGLRVMQSLNKFYFKKIACCLLFSGCAAWTRFLTKYSDFDLHYFTLTKEEEKLLTVPVTFYLFLTIKQLFSSESVLQTNTV